MQHKRTITFFIQQFVLMIFLFTTANSQPSIKPDKRDNKLKQYTIEQAISEKAQLHTIAFNGLAFLTGSYGADLFFPPGKVADYFGFQYMRDNDSNELGHNTNFLSRIAYNMLYILKPEQIKELTDLAVKQEKLYTDFAEKRFIIIKVFRQKLEGDSRELDIQAVINQFAALYEIDAKLSFHRAEVMGKVINSFTDEQKDYLSKLSFSNSAEWPVIDKKTLKREKLPHMQEVAVMTYASEMFSWYKGNLESDVYFCPERHGTYFGGFYLKDQPAMHNPGYSISTKLTGESGEEFLKLLNTEERQLFTGVVNEQKNNLEKIVSLRRDICTKLRLFISGGNPDESEIVNLVKDYGKLDGRLSIDYAAIFIKINKTITNEQRMKINELRKLDVVPKGGFFYSEPIALPFYVDCEFLFQPLK